MKCTKILFFTFPFAFTANGIPFQLYYLKTPLLEKNDLTSETFVFVVERYDFSEKYAHGVLSA